MKQNSHYFVVLTMDEKEREQGESLKEHSFTASPL